MSAAINLKTRILAPAGGFPSFGQMRAVYQDLAKSEDKTLRDALSATLTQHLGARQIASYSSGKAALRELLETLAPTVGDKILYCAAYTCPDIASAAIRAGYCVSPLEIDELTLEILGADVDLANRSGALLILSNLYGLPDSIDRMMENREQLIDDACQSALSYRDGVRVGTVEGTHGVFSFGRGKAICGFGGGAVVSSSLAARKSVGPPIGDELATLLKGVAYSLFERPRMYAIPGQLPFLALGETHCDLDFEVANAGLIQLLCSVASLKEETLTATAHRQRSIQISNGLDSLDIIQPFLERGGLEDSGIVPMRYPLVFPNNQLRDSAFARLSQLGLGASISYPKTLFDFSELSPHLLHREVPIARSVAERILTLPVHRYVTDSDVSQMTQEIRRVFLC